MTSLTDVISVASNIGSTVRTLSGLLGGDWRSRLRKASYGGVDFAMLDGQSGFGRRQVVHQYPFKDTPYVEDMGRKVRKFQVTGFIVGDDIISKRERLIGLAESNAKYQLVHPTYGPLTGSLLEFNIAEHWDKGRVFEISFLFVENGDRQYPQQSASSGSKIKALAALASIAAAADFATGIASSLKSGLSVIKQIAKSASSFGSLAMNLGKDATGLFNTVSNLSGTFGRFAGSAVGGLITSSVSDLIAKGVSSRAGLSTAVSAITTISKFF